MMLIAWLACKYNSQKRIHVRVMEILLHREGFLCTTSIPTEEITPDKYLIFLHLPPSCQPTPPLHPITIDLEGLTELPI